MSTQSTDLYQVHDPRELPPLPPPRDGSSLHGVKSLGFRLIDACNLHCHMCGQAAQRQERVELRIVKKRPFLELPVLQRVIDNAAPYRPQVYLWGGEPLMYPDLVPLLQHIATRKLNSFITTNGYMLDRFIEPLVDLKVAEVCVSIDGKPEVHDAIRGKEGTFDRAIRNLELLRDHKRERRRVLPLVDVHLVVLPENHKELLEFVDLVRRDQLCRRVRIQLPMYFTPEMSEVYRLHATDTFGSGGEESWNRFVGEWSDMDLDALAASWRELQGRRGIILLPNIAPEHVPGWFATPDVPYRTRGQTADARQKCDTCLVRINIEPNGDIVACTDFPESVIGNVHTDTLEDAYDGVRMQAHRAVARSESGAACGICSRCSYLYVY